MPLTPSSNPDHFGGARVRQKMRTITTRAGQSGQTAQLTVQTSEGRVVDLTAYEDLDLVVGFGERATNVGTEVAADIETPATGGVITFAIPDPMLQTPGIWCAAVYVRDDDDNTTVLDEFYLRIDRSAAGGTCGGPPTVPEIRLVLRDFPSENELLDTVDFDDTEITLAAGMCVDQWNDALPWDGPQHSTQTFPYRYNWMRGICGHLFLIAAEHYLRNMLQAQTGGIGRDDKNKWQQYEQRGQLVMQEWKKFVAERKTIESINSMGDGSIGGFMGCC